MLYKLHASKNKRFLIIIFDTELGVIQTADRQAERVQLSEEASHREVEDIRRTVR